jgi:hypothetical protein
MKRSSHPHNGTFRPLLFILVPVLIALLLPAMALATEPCSNTALRSGLSGGLPDCRGYEQVSPADKEGGSGGVLQGSGLALSDGSAITYSGEPFYHPKPKEPLESRFFEQYTSERSANGWSTLNGDTLIPETVPVPVLPASAVATGAQVLEETPDGSKVFFLDETNLTGTSNTAPSEPDLYQYDIPNNQLTDLTINTTEHPDARGILGTGGENTQEGTYIYYIAGGKLTPNAPTGQCGTGPDGEATGTGCKLYLYHNATTTYIATLSPKDEAGLTNARTTVFDWGTLPSERTAEVSPNGRYVAFGSRLPLTGQPAEPFEEKPGIDIPGAEIFRYDADATEKGEQSIVCVSCGSNGMTVPQSLLPFSLSTAINGANGRRYMLDNGRVLFNTIAGLVPGDTNRQTDVYEWEPSGLGDCTSSSIRFSQPSDGCIGLISAGNSETSPATLADASTNGSDIFFTTNQSLIPQDQDNITDLYDARENGGTPPPTPPACPQNTACPPTPTTQPTFIGASGSTTFTGTETPPPATTPLKPPSPKPLTRTQKLARALKACRTKRNKKQRATCETTAHKHYRPTPHTKKPKPRNTK